MATFPALTVCPYFNVAYKRDILQQHGIDVSDLRNSIKFPQNLNISLANFFKEVTYSVEEIMNSIEVGTGRKKPGKNETYFKFTDQEKKQASSNFDFLNILHQC